MSIFETVVASAATPVETTPLITMQDVRVAAAAAGKTDEMRAIDRLADFLAVRLETLDADIAFFDRLFPKVKSSLQVPGRDRSFWKNREAYMRWRSKVRRQIEHATGAVEARHARDARQDGWQALLSDLKILADVGVVHNAEYGALSKLADRARKIDVEPADLNREAIVRLLEEAPTANTRDTFLRSLRALDRYRSITSIAKHLPLVLEIDAGSRGFELVLPKHVEDQINTFAHNAARVPESYNPITGEYAKTLKKPTIRKYTSALRNYAWSASQERSGAIDLDSCGDISHLFSSNVFHSVIAFWTDNAEEPGALSPRSALGYVTDIMTVASRNGVEVAHMSTAKSISPFLLEGKEAEDSMSPKTLAFCRPIVDDRAQRRKFLTLHLAYRTKAEDILATDKILTSSRLTKARVLGACAAFAAIELAGAPMRVENVLSLRHRGPQPDLFLPTGKTNQYRIAVAASKLKGNKKTSPQIPIRRNALEGAQTLDWYLEKIRPLFPFGNPDWCASREDEPIDHIRFGLQKNDSRQTESIFLFVAPTSANHLSKSTFYNWISEASDDIGMAMTAHNFRHGLASILLTRSFSNLHKVANMLNNTPAVVQTYYAWINREAMLEEAQDDVLKELRL